MATRMSTPREFLPLRPIGTAPEHHRRRKRDPRAVGAKETVQSLGVPTPPDETVVGPSGTAFFPGVAKPWLSAALSARGVVPLKSTAPAQL
jgi:hypothetical protein